MYGCQRHYHGHLCHVRHQRHHHPGIHRHTRHCIPVHCHSHPLPGRHRRGGCPVLLSSGRQHAPVHRHHGRDRHLGSVHRNLYRRHHALCQGHQDSHIRHPHRSIGRQYPDDRMRRHCSHCHGEQRPHRDPSGIWPGDSQPDPYDHQHFYHQCSQPVLHILKSLQCI